MTAILVMASHIVALFLRQSMVMNAFSGTLISSSKMELIHSSPSRTKMGSALTTPAGLKKKKKKKKAHLSTNAREAKMSALIGFV